MLTLNDGRSELWQWDTGRKLTVDADCTQVHFSNKFFGRSVDVDVFDGTAEIPDVLLQVDKDLLVWAFVGTAENGYTKISKVFKVNKRNKPADYVFTPTEQTTLEEVLERIKKLEENPDVDVDLTGYVKSVNGQTPDENGNVEIKIPEGGGTVTDEQLAEAVNDALAQAKASGEFDGKDGKDGADGYTPQKGIDYDDGKSAYEYAKDGGYTGTEADFAAKLAEEYPDVPEWAMKESKPSYSKSEVGLGNVDNVKQYSPSNPPPYPVVSVNGQTGKVHLGAADVGARPSNWMPTAQEVGALPATYVPPDQTAAQVGADPAGTAAAAVSSHNTSTDSHGDLRLELKAINDRLTAFFDSDNQTLDELSEIVAYITSNKSLIDSITTSKVSVADIINNLTTNVDNKPLSAAQGVVLKGLIDAVSNSLSNYQPMGDYALTSAIPTKVSQLQNDKGYLTEHQDISGKLDADKLPEAVNAALAQAKDSGEFDGDPGASGVTPHIGSNGNWYIGSADTGVKAHGKDGTSVTVKSVSESTADGGSNVVTFSDGKTLNVKNGSKGNKGDPGTTPQKGIDFWTPADQEAIVQQVITALGTPVFGRVDADNNIILTGELADGTYTIKYEDADGEVVEIGTIEVGEKMPTSGYVEVTWVDGVKLDKTNGTEGSGTDYAASGHIELVDGYTYTVKQTMYDGSRYGGMNVLYYNADGGFISCKELWSSDSAEHSVVLTPPTNAATFRLRLYHGTAFKPGMWPVYFEKTA